MRLTWSAMLQHNNNNNYPCLKATPHEAPLKCSSATQPLPSRLELGLADLPLIRGLRAWALCSKNRQKGGAPPSGGRAPVTPPTSRRTSCPRSAWGSGYGLPQAGVGALVTVATLKTSEGNGKTQTQCLFLRNEKGSCLYSTSGGTSGAGGWLRGKSGTSTGRRDVSAVQTQAPASRVRVRSARRWRKSTHVVGRDKRHPDEEVAEKLERQSKAGPEGKACLEQRGPRGSSECLQNMSNEESTRKSSHGASQEDETLPDEEVKVKQEEPDKLCLDCLVSPEGEPKESPGFRQNPSNEESQRKSCHVDKRLPEEEVAEKQIEPHKADPQRVTSPDEGADQKNCGPGESPECLQNASNEESLRKSSHVTSQDKRLPDEDVTEKQEGGNKLDLVSPDEGPCRKSRGPSRSPGCFQIAVGEESERKSSHVARQDKRLPDGEVTDKQEEPNKVSPERLASPEGGLCQKSRELQRSRGFLARREDTPSGEITGMKREWEGNAEEDEERKELCQNDPSILLRPNPDLESTHCHTERKGGNDPIQTPFDDITATSSCIKDSYPAGGSTGQAEVELCLVGRSIRNSGAHPVPEHNVTNTTKDSSSSSSPTTNFRVNFVEGKEADWTPNEFAPVCMVVPAGPRLHNPTPALPTSGTMATSQPCAGAEEVEKGGQDGIELESRDEKQEEEEDEFGGFMQAEGGEECSQGVTVPVPLPCESSVAFGSGDVSGESCDSWTAFPQDVWDEGRDVVGQWWPDEERTDMVDHELDLLFAAAFPSLPTSADRHPTDVIPTLTQLLGGSSSQEQRLLEVFHDVSKMSIHKYKRGGGDVNVSRGLLLSSLHVEQPNSVTCESRAANWWSNRRPSPGLHSPNQNARNAAAKRRLSCDYNRSVPE
ncbi:uncharacterized protein LOC144052582 [Vanacampus margaritifer]